MTAFGIGFYCGASLGVFLGFILSGFFQASRGE